MRNAKRPPRPAGAAGPLHLREALGIGLIEPRPRQPDASAAAQAGERRLADLIAPLCGEAADLVAARLLQCFGSLSALFRANRRALQGHLPGQPDLVELLLAVRPLVMELLKAEMLDAPVLPDNRSAIRYLHARMAHEPAEQVRVLYLDAKNRILREEVAARGSVTKTDIFPREIVRRALDLGATGLIMAHNHPSGDPEPSRHDLTATRAVSDAARLFDILLHDHIVIGRSGYRSLREEGYL
jgi:DNA repair protein RadC